MLRQEFELGGKRRRRVELARAETALAGWDGETMRDEVATAVGVRFLSVLGAQHRVESWSRYVEYVEQLHVRVLGLVDSGVMRSLEAQQVTRQLGLARIELQRAESDLSTARFRLAATWGSRSPRFSEAVGDLERRRPVPDLQTVIDMAQHSPAISRWDAELARGEAALALAKARRVPDLRVGFGVRWEDDFDERDYLLDLEFPLPIFDRKQGDILEARHEMSRAQAARGLTEATSAAEIAEAYNQLTESEARRMTLKGEVLPAARAAFEAFRAGFENEPGNPGDLLDARRDVVRAEVQYAEALVDYRQALEVLEGIVGQSFGEAEPLPEPAN
jgi:cobalt-zinc-cadmium efflux system outer membrane protein